MFLSIGINTKVTAGKTGNNLLIRDATKILDLITGANHYLNIWNQQIPPVGLKIKQFRKGNI